MERAVNSLKAQILLLLYTVKAETRFCFMMMMMLKRGKVRQVPVFLQRKDNARMAVPTFV